MEDDGSGPSRSQLLQNWAVALIVGSVQLLLALLLRQRPRSLVTCLRRACSFKWRLLRHPGWGRRQKRHNLTSPNSVRSRAQRHWSVLRLHVFEQGNAERSQEAHYERRYRETHFGRRSVLLDSFRKTVDQKYRSHYHPKAQACDILHFLTSFKDSQVRHPKP